LRSRAGGSGAHAIIADFDPAVAADGRRQLEGLGLDVETVEMDVTSSEQVRQVADDLNARLGHVDILVNNAGIARSGAGGEETTDEHWLHVNDVNYNGVFRCCRDFGRHMIGRKTGAL
jgi:NAD(P)-dependent dehydrogenase (short-subunit alcohol dehydrogenase family)